MNRWVRISLLVPLLAGWATPGATPTAVQVPVQPQTAVVQPLDPQIRAALDRVRLQAGRTAQLGAQLGEAQRAIRNSERDLARLKPMDRLLRVKGLTESVGTLVGEAVAALDAIRVDLGRLHPERTPVEPLLESVEILRGWVCKPTSFSGLGRPTGCSSKVDQRYCNADPCLSCCDTARPGDSEEHREQRLLCKYFCVNEAAACTADRLAETACRDLTDVQRSMEGVGSGTRDEAIQALAASVEATRDALGLAAQMMAGHTELGGEIRKIGS